MHTAWTYILANKRRPTLYVGMTTDLPTRLWEHRTKQNPASFTSRYNLDRLVYYEGFQLVTEAIDRDKFIKGKSRKWKIELIERINPEWKDLSELVSAMIKK